MLTYVCRLSKNWIEIRETCYIRTHTDDDGIQVDGLCVSDWILRAPEGEVQWVKLMGSTVCCH